MSWLFGHAQTAVGVIQELGLLFFFPPNVLLFMFPRPNCLSAFKPACQAIKSCVLLLGALACTQPEPLGCLCPFPWRQNASVLSKSRLPNGSLREQSTARTHREVLRALNTSCCHLSASLKRYLANLFGTDPGAAHAATRKGEVHLGKLLPDEFLTTLNEKLRQTRVFDNWSILLPFPLV